MATQEAPSFSSEHINQALDAARAHSESMQASLQSGGQLAFADGALSISAQCISVTVQNHKVCLNLPFGIGHICLPVPGWVPQGSAAQACLNICTHWGIPCGIQVTVSVAGHPVIKKGFGCSC